MEIGSSFASERSQTSLQLELPVSSLVGTMYVKSIALGLLPCGRLGEYEK